MKEKIAVYTCITGNYDELQEISKNVFENNIDYYCFTNNKNIKSNTWKVIYIEDFLLTNHMLNRKIKILGHELINDKYDVLVWIDGNVVIKEKISKFFAEQCNLKEYSFCAFKHPDRNCIYDEGPACVRLKKDNKDIILKQLSFYEKDGYPRNNGLCEMGIFVRRNNDKIVQETMQLWYEMINKYSKRDQLSFMWCVKKRKLRLQVIPLTIDDNKYFLRVNLWTGLLGVYIRSCSNGEKFIIGKSCVNDFCRSFYGSWLWGNVQAAKTVVENLVIKKSTIF